MTSPPFDNSIPELTEVIIAKVVPAAETVVAPPPAPRVGIRATRRFDAAAPPSAVQKINDENTSAQGVADWSDDEWRRLETEARGRIAHQVLGRIDFVIEQRVRDSLADVLQTAVEGLANEIKQGLRVTLEDVIARAVAQEITRLKKTRK